MQYGESVTPENDKIEVNHPCIVCGSGDIGCDSLPTSVTQGISSRCGCGLIYNMICKGFYVEEQG
jgi:hypothetical protein